MTAMRYAILAADGECYALRDTVVEASAARVQAEEYLHEAASCGHPAAPAWVAARLPFRLVCVSVEKAAELLEDGTPVLDREP